MAITILRDGWFSDNISKTVKAVTMTFSSEQQHFIRNMFAKIAIPSSS